MYAKIVPIEGYRGDEISLDTLGLHYVRFRNKECSTSDIEFPQTSREQNDPECSQLNFK
jgi:hypothetical protein